jgi:hypothetical protein
VSSADQIIRPINVPDIELELPSLAKEAVEELYRFGQIMVSSSQQRALRLDAKLTGVLNWSSAVLAFVLIDANVSHQKGFGLAVSLMAIAAALASVAASYFGLKSRLWERPSEGDWFKTELLRKPETLQRYHVVSMLNVHQTQSEGNERCAGTLKTAEIFLAISGAVTFAMLVARLIS